MKKLLTLILALAMALSLVACGSSDKKDDSGEKTYTVGVVQLVQHEALDAATKGCTDALKEALGDKVNVVVKNASGDSNTCGTIVNGFLADNVDLIMANATPALQAAASATSTTTSRRLSGISIEFFSNSVINNRPKFIRSNSSPHKAK